mgnify:CR=1 FL=1
MKITLKELSKRTGTKVETLRGLLKRNNVKSDGTRINNKNPELLFELDDAKKAIKSKIKIVEIPTIIYKRETEVYHIYESKMNYISDL